MAFRFKTIQSNVLIENQIYDAKFDVIRPITKTYLYNFDPLKPNFIQ